MPDIIAVKQDLVGLVAAQDFVPLAARYKLRKSFNVYFAICRGDEERIFIFW
ncbi:MAG: hypothetical protein NT121_10930 [Chloroflexi bacterium]|nr:hypothetical protein [Chloroflexota bacterium]